MPDATGQHIMAGFSEQQHGQGGGPPSRRDSTDSQSHLLAHDAAMAAEDGQHGGRRQAAAAAAEVDDEAARRIVRRIDLRIMPLLFLTSMLNFTDKAILSSAAVFGLRADTHLRGAQYAWAASAFYLGYLVWNPLAARLAQRLPVARYLGVDALVWGGVVAATAACRGFGSLFAARLLLGAAEAAVVPCLVRVTGAWYTRDEIPARTGVWFAGNSLGGILSSLLALGVGAAVPEGHGGAWRWMFGILGFLTLGLGLLVLARLPDSIASARFLDASERRWARDRVVVAGLGSTETTAAWRWDQARECLADPQTWLIVCLALLCQIPNGGTQNFANLVVTSFGFSPLQSALVNIPYSLLSMAAIAGTGWLAGRFRSLNCILIALVVLPPVAGSALISHRASLPRSVSLVGYFLLSSGPSALPLLLSLSQSNVRGASKKTTLTALLFLAYCVGNIAGPQLFATEAESPTYRGAFRAILVCYSLVVGLALVLRAYLSAVNSRRRREEGVEGSAGASGAVGGGKVVEVGRGGRVAQAVGEVVLRPEDYEDITDWKTFGFRYRL
ncbi:MFS general substrate transporter [Xylaria palmicola]|nr:MFS general substrate transporter [Xylaria palmicola]